MNERVNGSDEVKTLGLRRGSARVLTPIIGAPRLSEEKRAQVRKICAEMGMRPASAEKMIEQLEQKMHWKREV